MVFTQLTLYIPTGQLTHRLTPQNKLTPFAKFNEHLRNEECFPSEIFVELTTTDGDVPASQLHGSFRSSEDCLDLGQSPS